MSFGGLTPQSFWTAGPDTDYSLDATFDTTSFHNSPICTYAYIATSKPTTTFFITTSLVKLNSSTLSTHPTAFLQSPLFSSLLSHIMHYTSPPSTLPAYRRGLFVVTSYLSLTPPPNFQTHVKRGYARMGEGRTGTMGRDSSGSDNPPFRSQCKSDRWSRTPRIR